MVKYTKILRVKGGTNMFKRIVIFIIIGILLMSIMSCSRSKSVSKGHSSFSNPRNKTDEYTFEVRSSQNSIDMEFDITIEEGLLLFSLTNPNGEVAWCQEISSSDKFKRKESFEAIEGLWNLEVTMKEAVGRYSHEWIAK